MLRFVIIQTILQFWVIFSTRIGISGGMETNWQGRAKWLAQILIISVTLNAGLVATLCYFAVRDRQTFMAYDLTPLDYRPARASLSQTNEEVLSALSESSYEDLIRLLGDDTLIEEGYAIRDLALTTLCAFHHFDLERAAPLIDVPVKQAIFTNGDDEKIALTFYPNLTNQHFDAIQAFARFEKYPLTTEGIFMRLVAAPNTKDLQKAFTRTFEFQALQSLFRHAGDPLTDDQLMMFLLAHDWASIQKSAEHLRRYPHFTLETKRDILTLFLRDQSKIAAELLASQDTDYVIKRLSNGDLQQLLSLLPDEHPARSTIIAAAERSLRPDFTSPVAQVQAFEPRTHLIREGDTLWDIARHYRVNLESLKKYNNIQSEYRLMPGNKLLIPE